MSTQGKPEFTAAAMSEQEVRDYLTAHPDFFERHGTLLGSLRLPHITGGTVSLVERQVSVLRQKDLRLKSKLKELLKVAHANDQLAARIHKLSLGLLAADSLAAALDTVESTMRLSFGADQTVLVLFADPDLIGDIAPSRFFRPLRRDAAEIQPFATFMQAGKPRCGQIRDAQRDFLFGRDTDEIGSVALIPLGRQCATGILAIGSADASRFHPGMGIDFLGRIGELIAATLRRF